jgi:hypothetical protein
MGAKNRIDLVIPGFFGPIRVRSEDLPDLPSVSRILGRADRERAGDSDPMIVLFDRFGIDLDRSQDPPSAPFSRLADTPSATREGYWLHADPVHLHLDRDRLLLFDARHLGLEPEEADSLAGLFNGHFAADGLRLETPAVDRWYLRVEPAPRLRTHALADVVGRVVDRSYLGGEDAARWMGWLNEVQMLFHEADVNQRRELDGKPRVSGIWPWGGGTLPANLPGCRYPSVFGGDVLFLGLAKSTETAARPIPDHPQAMLSAGGKEQILVFWDGLRPAVLDGDAGAWVQALLHLSSWLDELLALVRTGEVEEVALYPCDGTRLAINRRALRRFWRRPVGIWVHLAGRRA